MTIAIDGLKQCRISNILLSLYKIKFRVLRKYVIKIINRMEGGAVYSYSLRYILKKYQGVEVGAYSYGPCVVPGAFPSGVRVGRYVSIANGVRVFLRNHPIKFISLHPFFYNTIFGFVDKDLVESGKLEISHDAWIGFNTIITPGCKRIGIGAIVGAGSIVTKDVPDFAVFAGNPAKLIRYRFEPETIEAILKTRWWERPIDNILPVIGYMTHPLNEGCDLEAFQKAIRSADEHDAA